MRTSMTAVGAPMHDRLRRRVAGSIAAAVVALCVTAAPALAGSVADAPCTRKDPVCLNKPAKAPSPAPADQAAPKSGSAAATAAHPVRKPYTPPAVPGTSFWDDLSNFALTWGPLIFMGLICALI